MENKPSISRLRRIKSTLEKKQKKYVTLDMLSRYVGLYSDVVADELVYFEPMVKMDTSMNMMDVLPLIQDYLAQVDETNKENREKKQIYKTGYGKPKLQGREWRLYYVWYCRLYW